MSGVAWAISAGVGFGVFQAVNRRANLLVDVYRVTFLLMLFAAIALGLISVATQDLSVVGDTPLWAFGSFFIAGAIHFFGGWTFLGLSQERIGASNTGVVVAATPLIGSLMAFFFLDEPLPAWTVVGVVLVVIGVALISMRQGVGGKLFGTNPWYALGAATSWGTSPVFIRKGLEGLPVPLIGVTVGLLGAATIYGLTLWLGHPKTRGTLDRLSLKWILIGAALVGTAIASQWTAFDLIEISVAITLMQLATPVVILVAPIIVGTEAERITWRLVLGMAAVVGGSMLVIWTRPG